MIEGTRMILQRRMQIGLRGVAGIAGLGEQGQVSQAEPGDQFAVGVEPGLVCCGQRSGKGKNAEHGAGQQADDHQGNSGRTGHYNRLRMVEVILSLLAPNSSTAANFPAGSMT